MADRQNFTRATANEIGERAKSPIGESWCEWCFALTRKRQLHHLDQDAMKRPEDKRRPLTARDGVLICKDCHDKISKVQAVEFNKAERVRAMFNGVERTTVRPIPSRGFAPPAAKDRTLTTLTKRANGVPAIRRAFAIVED